MAQMTRGQKMRLGVFLVTGAACVLVAILVLGARALLEDRDTYLIRFSNKDLSFSGLDPGASVKYSGIKVGRVEEIHIARDDVSIIEVVISLSEGTPVAEDSTASLGSLGITGLKYVELSRGSPTARIRAPGEEIPAGDSFIDELSARALSIASQLEATLKNVQAMTNTENQERLARLLESTAKMIEDNQQNLQQISTNLNAASEGGTQLIERINTFAANMETTRANLDTLILTAQGALGEQGLTGTVTSANDILGQTSLLMRRNQVILEATLRDLSTSAENLFDLTQNVKDNPSLLFRGPKGTGEDLTR